MKLDYLTLFAVVGFMDIILVAILIYYITVVKTKKWFVITYLIYKLLETLALIGFGLRNIISDVLSILIANIILYLSILIQLVSVISYDGKFNKKITINLSILTIASIVLFTIFISEAKIRTGISSFSIAILFIAGAIYLFSNRQSYKFPLLLTTGFALYAIVSFSRGMAVITSHGPYNFQAMETWDALLILGAITSILVSSFGFLLLLKEIDEQTIFNQNRMTSIAFTKSPVSIVVTDPNGNIQFVNPKFSELTGYSFKEARGKNTNILNTELTPKETIQSLWQTISSGKTWSGEFVNKKKNGETYYEEAVITPILNSKKKIINYLAIKIDITNRKINEKLVEERNKELQEINHTKDRLFSIIGHDLKGPFGNLKQLLEFIRQDIEKGDIESVQQIIKMSKDTADSTFDFLENLLNWSRSQLNVIEPNRELIDVTNIINEACHLYQSSLQQKKITLTNNSKGAMQVVIDKEMISAVIRNLFSNAIKFTPIYGSIIIETVKRDHDIVIAIKDSGVGIEKERQGKLFNFTENQSTRGTSGEKGTGLGLVLANEFVTKNDGELWVESEPNQGCAFFVSLPKQNIKSA